MNFSIRRVNALCKKEIKDFLKNTNVSVVCALPILISIILSKMAKENIAVNTMHKTEILSSCLNINYVMISSFVIGMLIAEEKEKNTLRTLMLSAVSPLEFLTGKALITLFVSLLNNGIMFFIIGIDKNYFGLYMLLTTLVVFTMIEIGALLGIISQNQMAMSVVGLPIIGIFLIVPMLAKTNKILGKLAKLLPNNNMDILLEKIFKGEKIGMESVYNILVILIWIIFAAAAFAYAYNKKGVDK